MYKYFEISKASQGLLSILQLQFEPGHCNAHGSNLPKEVGVHSTKVLAGLYARDTSSHSPEGGTVNTAE